MNKSLEDVRVIDELTDRDIVALHQLLVQQWWGHQRTLDSVRTMVANSTLVIGLVTGPESQLVGSCRVLSDYAYRAMVYDVMVDQQWQGLGLGKLLMDTINQHPCVRDVTTVYLCCEPTMMPFYEKWGFVLYDNQRQRTHWMVKSTE